MKIKFLKVSLIFISREKFCSGFCSVRTFPCSHRTNPEPGMFYANKFLFCSNKVLFYPNTCSNHYRSGSVVAGRSNNNLSDAPEAVIALNSAGHLIEAAKSEGGSWLIFLCCQKRYGKAASLLSPPQTQQPCRMFSPTTTSWSSASVSLAFGWREEGRCRKTIADSPLGTAPHHLFAQLCGRS